jgi:CheY-like chemotaxis protein
MPVRGASREEPARDAAPAARGTAHVAARPDPLTGLRVLAVDDDEDARDLLGAVLSQHGAYVATAASAKAAFETLGAFRPDVIVCDLGMPDEDGLSFMRRVRAAERLRGESTPAIALTAYARDEDAQRALSAGFQVHVAKPVEPARIVACVASLGGRAAAPAAATP